MVENARHVVCVGVMLHVGLHDAVHNLVERVGVDAILDLATNTPLVKVVKKSSAS